FFFSSRRRHTRCYRDWSSDVCSSDLQRAAPSSALLDRRILKAKPASDESFRAIESEWQGTASRRRMLLLPFLHHVLGLENLCRRSEERRVGKECSAGWGRDDVRRKEQ